MASKFQIEKLKASETLLELFNRIGELDPHPHRARDARGESINNINDKYTGEHGSAEAISRHSLRNGVDKYDITFLEDYSKNNKNLLISYFERSPYGEGPVAGNQQSTVKDPVTNDLIYMYSPRSPTNNRDNNLPGHHYPEKFNAAFGDGHAGDAPSNEDIEVHARKRFNLGQQLGYQFGDPYASSDSIWENVNTLLRDIGTGASNFSDFLTFVSDKGNKERLAGHFSPNFNRVPVPVPEKIPLESLLNQNLLKPSGAGQYQRVDDGTTFYNIAPGVGVFRDSYLKNRGKMKADQSGSYTQFPEGIIGGVPVHDLQEPRNPRGNKPTEGKVFSFEDDAEYLTPDRQERGFNNNIRVEFPNYEPAVINMTPKTGVSVIDNVKYHNDDLEAAGLSDKQIFPFMFETENKQGVKQYAFFQAALTQLQESYSPSWTSKSFIGRTEKIHTYVDTERVLDLSFAAFAMTARALQNLRERVTWLAQQTYGEHENSGGTITRVRAGPLLRLTIGDIFNGVPGYLRNLSFDWNFLGPGGKWELTRGLVMPQGVSIQCSYQVIHDKLPDRDFDFYRGLETHMPASGDKALIPLEGSWATRGEELSGMQESYLQRLALKNSPIETTTG